MKLALRNWLLRYRWQVGRNNSFSYICTLYLICIFMQPNFSMHSRLLFKHSVLSCIFTQLLFVVVVFFMSSAEPSAGFSNKESVQKEVKASLSQKATLSCEVSDSKTEVKWYKDGKLLTTSKEVRIESKGKSRALVIEKVDKKDAGEYTCEAGTEKLVFKLKLTGDTHI